MRRSLENVGPFERGAYLSEVILILLNVHHVRREGQRRQQFPEDAVDVAVEYQDSAEQDNTRKDEQVSRNDATYSAKVEVLADLSSYRLTQQNGCHEVAGDDEEPTHKLFENYAL